MGIIGQTVPVGRHTKRVLFQNPSGAPVPDPSGEGYTQAWVDVPPTALVAMESATATALERITSGAVTTGATHIVRLPYRAGISTATRIVFEGRILNVTSVDDPEEAHKELILVCQEAVG